MPRALRVALSIVVSVGTVANGYAIAQQFGRNKVEYVDFDFKVFDTEHFAVYHYSSEEATARLVARLAERWHARFSRILEHKLRNRQPLILYGSQPEFAQTNVVSGFLGEGIGGVTESAKRRIVMPFAPTLAETDRILGHEIAHAFQFDMARQYGGGLMWPLWAVEGMAQYLALGATDAETAMWLRDAVASDLLPRRQQDAARKFSPYRYGHAMWAYLAGRFGDRVIADLLKTGRSGAFHRRVLKVTGVELDQLFADWRGAASEQYTSKRDGRSASSTPMLRDPRAGRLYLGPSLSPDGRQAIFFSEKDRLSLDLFLADTTTGSIRRKLATTAATARFESLQAIRSAGAWSPTGDRVVFAAIDRGQPALVILDVRGRGTDQQIKLPQFGQILTPAWSPDGRAIAFSALEGGVTDLYIYDLTDGGLKRLTDDPYADLQPSWAPDGRRIAFVTDRYSTDLTSLDFGPCELGIADVAADTITPMPAVERSRHVNPQWSADGGSVYFVSDPGGTANVYRVDVLSGQLWQVTDVEGGVSGLTSTSPVLSVARAAPVMAFTSYRNGKYGMEIRTGASTLEGQALSKVPEPGSAALPSAGGAGGLVDELLRDTGFGLTDPDTLRPRAYVPALFVEAIGPPYIASGGGPFGTFVRGGGSLLFSDLLGERKLVAYAQVGNRLRDLALGLRYLNRERRWNWGASAEVQPSLRRLPRARVTEEDGQPALTHETHYFERTQFRLAGQVAYPMNQAQRLEFDAGVRHITYRLNVQSMARSLETGRVISRTMAEGFGGAPATVGEASAAFVHDTAILGPTSPILGGRSRLEVASTFGELSVTRLLVDHRRYFMPARPYTLAARILHLGQYGRDAHDPRLLPSFLGSRQFVHGYGWSSLRCSEREGECGAYEDLLGSRLLVGNLELRVPVTGMLSRDLRYGPVPVEAFLFGDTGYVWAQSPAFTIANRGKRLISSFGIGARVSAFGFPLELAAVRAMNAPARGWSFDFSFKPGF